MAWFGSNFKQSILTEFQLRQEIYSTVMCALTDQNRSAVDKPQLSVLTLELNLSEDRLKPRDITISTEFINYTSLFIRKQINLTHFTDEYEL